MLNPEKSFKFDSLEGNAQTMLIESMFSSNAPTLLKYSMDENGTDKLIFGHKTEISQQIDDIQKGILDFCALYSKATKDIKKLLFITGVDAFCPYQTICKDYDYFYLMFSNVKEYEDGFPRMKGKRRLTTIGRILKERNLV
jgi:hypothetical protein